MHAHSSNYESRMLVRVTNPLTHVQFHQFDVDQRLRQSTNQPENLYDSCTVSSVRCGSAFETEHKPARKSIHLFGDRNESAHATYQRMYVHYSHTGWCSLWSLRFTNNCCRANVPLCPPHSIRAMYHPRDGHLD